MRGVGGDSRALEKSLTDGLHVNGVAEGLTDPDISQGGGGAVLLVELVEVEQAGIAHVDSVTVMPGVPSRACTSATILV